MIFLRAFGLTRFAESQQTRRSAALCARRRTSTRFPQAQVKVNGVWDNCHCLAWRLLVGVCYARVNPRVGPRQSFEGRERTQPRADARDAVPNGRTQSRVHMALIKVHGESYYGAHRLPAGKTAAERR